VIYLYCMKNTFLFCCFLLAGTASAQSGFMVTETDTFSYKFSTDLHNAYRLPDAVTHMTIDYLEFDTLDAFDISEFVNLRELTVTFPVDPEMEDKKRIPIVDKFVADVTVWLPVFAAKCPHLRVVFFKLGEQVFLSDKEKKELGKDKYERKRKERNLENAWKSFGMQVQKDMRDVKMVAYDWGW
jgi:hypothetical protein